MNTTRLYSRISNFIYGFAFGVILTSSIAVWSQTPLAGKLILGALGVILVVIYLLKCKSNHSYNNPDNNSNIVIVGKSRNKSDGSTNDD